MPGPQGLGVPDFAIASSEMTFLPGEGLSGRVWATCAPAWVADVTQDSDFPRGQLAFDAGFRAAVAFPIMQGGGVAGV